LSTVFAGCALDQVIVSRRSKDRPDIRPIPELAGMDRIEEVCQTALYRGCRSSDDLRTSRCYLATRRGCPFSRLFSEPRPHIRPLIACIRFWYPVAPGSGISRETSRIYFWNLITDDDDDTQQQLIAGAVANTTALRVAVVAGRQIIRATLPVATLPSGYEIYNLPPPNAPNSIENHALVMDAPNQEASSAPVVSLQYGSGRGDFNIFDIIRLSSNLVNLIAFACAIYWSRKLLTRLFMIEPFIILGRASLQVFCAHLAFVFVGLELLYGTVSQLHGLYAVGLVALTFVGLIFVALHNIRRDRQERTTNNPELKINQPHSYVEVLTGD
jgi:hypothetical protein